MSIYFYRVTDTFDEHGAIASLVAYESVKETPKGYWVKPKGSCNWMEFAHMRKVKMARWISKTSTKRLAYPTIKEAVDSFRRRKYRQLERLKAQLEVCELAVNNPRIIASDLELSDFPHDEFRLGAMESTRGWVFDF